MKRTLKKKITEYPYQWEERVGLRNKRISEAETGTNSDAVLEKDVAYTPDNQKLKTLEQIKSIKKCP